MNTDALLQGRFKDLANKAYQKNIYTFTNFLSASDLDIFYSILPDINHVPYQIFGGREGCDRVMIRFGSEDMTGYELPFSDHHTSDHTITGQIFRRADSPRRSGFSDEPRY